MVRVKVRRPVWAKGKGYVQRFEAIGPNPTAKPASLPLPLNLHFLINLPTFMTELRD
jgi:hypothetical protein